MGSGELQIVGLAGVPEVRAGDSVGKCIGAAIREAGIGIHPGDIFVVAQKIVSKAEGRVVRLDSVKPSERALSWAAAHGRDPRLVEVVLGQTRRIVRMERGHMIVENLQGFICANAGVDTSNVAAGSACLLPENCDRSAQGIGEELAREFKVPLAVIVSDSFGRPWRLGLVNVALGVAGLKPLLDYRGSRDSSGTPLTTTVIAVADELASAAELVMGKISRVPVALIHGFKYNTGGGSGQAMIRPAAEDLFR